MPTNESQSISLHCVINYVGRSLTAGLADYKLRAPASVTVILGSGGDGPSGADRLAHVLASCVVRQTARPSLSPTPLHVKIEQIPSKQLPLPY